MAEQKGDRRERYRVKATTPPPKGERAKPRRKADGAEPKKSTKKK